MPIGAAPGKFALVDNDNLEITFNLRLQALEQMIKRFMTLITRNDNREKRVGLPNVILSSLQERSCERTDALPSISVL